MRKWICASLVAGAALIAAGGIRADNGLQVSLSVKDDIKHTRVKEKKGDVYKFPFFSIYRDAAIKNCTLDITVSSRSEKGVPCQLEWYFISEKTTVPEPSERLVDQSESHSITETIIPDRSEPVLTVVSPGKDKMMLQGQKPVQKTATATLEYAKILVDKFDAYGDQSIKTYEYYMGDTYVGYIVLVTVDGNVVAKTSDRSWLLDDQWIKKCQDSWH